MSLTSVFNQLGQTVMPAVLAAVMPDTMTIQAENPTTDGAGGYTMGTPTSAYTSVPCAYEPGGGSKFDNSDKLISTQGYTVTFPTHQSGSRINATPAHRLVVNARGNEPAKTFRIIALKDDMGVVFEAFCVREN